MRRMPMLMPVPPGSVMRYARAIAPVLVLALLVVVTAAA